MIELKPLEIGDIEWIRQLRNENSQYFFNKEQITESEQRQWYNRYQFKKSYDFFIIVEGGEKIGTISVYDKIKYREIGNILIKKEYRDKGIFKKVMDIIANRYSKPFIAQTLFSNNVTINSFKHYGYKEQSITFILS